MAFTFLAAEGVAVGKTQIEQDWLEVRVEGAHLCSSTLLIVDCRHVAMAEPLGVTFEHSGVVVL